VLTNGPDAPTAIHLVLDGDVDECGADGQVRRHQAPRIVGGLEALSGRTRRTVVAATDIETLTLLDAGPALWELLEESFDLTLACLAEIAHATCVVRRRLLPSGGYSAPDTNSIDERPLEPAAQIAAMHSAGPLAGAPIHALGLLVHEGTLVHADGDRRIWSIGDDADRVLAVLAGRLRASSPEGHAFDFGAGAIVGADTALAGEPRWFDLVATGRVTFLDLPTERLLDVLEDDWPMAAHVLRVVARELVTLRS
jgi:CRP-like cAMP-binding protein